MERIYIAKVDEITKKYLDEMSKYIIGKTFYDLDLPIIEGNEVIGFIERSMSRHMDKLKTHKKG